MTLATLSSLSSEDIQPDTSGAPFEKLRACSEKCVMPRALRLYQAHSIYLGNHDDLRRTNF